MIVVLVRFVAHRSLLTYSACVGEEVSWVAGSSRRPLGWGGRYSNEYGGYGEWSHRVHGFNFKLGFR